MYDCKCNIFVKNTNLGNIQQALPYTLGRFAFAPKKNGRLDNDADAENVGIVLHSLICSMHPQIEWTLHLFLHPPYEFGFPCLQRGTRPVKLLVNGDASLDFPGHVLREHDADPFCLGDVLLECFRGFDFAGARLPMLIFLQRLWACSSEPGIALQRQICWSLGQSIEAVCEADLAAPSTEGIRCQCVRE